MRKSPPTKSRGVSSACSDPGTHRQLQGDSGWSLFHIEQDPAWLRPRLPQPSSVSFRNSSWRSEPCGGPASGPGSVSSSVSEWHECGVHRAPRVGGRSGLLGSPWWGGWAASESQTLGARPILGHLLGAQAPGLSRKPPGGGRCPGWEAWLGWGTGPGILCSLLLRGSVPTLSGGHPAPPAAARPPHGAWLGMGLGQDWLISMQGPLPWSCPPAQPGRSFLSSPQADQVPSGDFSGKCPSSSAAVSFSLPLQLLPVAPRGLS